MLFGRQTRCRRIKGWKLRHYNVWNQLHYGPDPVGIIRPVVGMCAPFPEHHVDQKRTPANVQWLKALFELTGRFVALAFLGTIIIEHHGINAQFNDFWIFNVQPPNKQLIEYFIVGHVANNGQFSKIAFDLMGRCQLSGVVFEKCRVAFVLFPLVKTRHGHVRAIYKECKQLFYKPL